MNKSLLAIAALAASSAYAQSVQIGGVLDGGVATYSKAG